MDNTEERPPLVFHPRLSEEDRRLYEEMYRNPENPEDDIRYWAEMGTPAKMAQGIIDYLC